MQGLTGDHGIPGIDGIPGRPVRDNVAMTTLLIFVCRAKQGQKDKREKLVIVEIEQVILSHSAYY